MANTSPLVSIITVVFNGEQTIEQAIQSVLRQDYANIEYIIIDGASTDRTMAVVGKYRDQISTIISEQDEGIYDAMNKGIGLARGELIGMINSDDWYEENIISRVVEQYLESGDNCVYHGRLRIVDENGVQTGIQNPVVDSRFFMRVDCSVCHPTTFIPRRLYQKYGLYDTAFEIAADYDLLLRLYLKKIPFIYLDAFISNFRMGGLSWGELDDKKVGKNHLRSEYEAHRTRMKNGFSFVESYGYYLKHVVFVNVAKVILTLGLDEVITFYRQRLSRKYRDDL